MKIIDSDYCDFLIQVSNYFRAAGSDEVLQVLKVAEEVGEAAEAVHMWKGCNPRKAPGRAYDVAQELGDVVCTALVAIVHLGFDPNHILEDQRQKTEERFLDHPA